MYYADYVKETSTTTGTGNVTLGGAVTGHQSFASVVPVGDPFEYSIIDANGTGREIGIGTMQSSTTFSRDTILTSTNSGAAISLSSGTHTILMAPSAEAINKRSVMADTMLDFVQSGLVVPTTSGSLTGSISAGVAYVVGQRVVKGAQSRAYTASKDTYVDLSNTGVLTYVEVANNATAPSITVNSIRLGKVVTGSSAITSGADLRNLYSSPIAVVVTTTTQTITGNGVATPVVFGDGEIVNNNGMHSVSSNNSRYTCAIPGLYMVTAGYSINSVVSTSAPNTALIDTLLRLNGTTSFGHMQFPSIPNSQSAVMQVNSLIPMQAGDYVEVVHTHYVVSASSQTINNAYLSIARVV